MSGGGRRGDVLGVALTPASVTAAAASVPTVWSADLQLNGGANGSRDALAAALAQAARASGLETPALVVALLPPLAETRTIALPPLRADDRNLFLARNASRYFVSARGAQVVGTRAATPAAKGAEAGPVLATSTAQQLMQAVQFASEAAGCPLRSVVPAEVAWAAAAVAIWPEFARRAGHVIMTRDDRSDLLSLNRGSLDSVRRFRGPADAAQIAAMLATAGDARVALMGTPDAVDALRTALAGAGASVMVPEPKWLELTERPDALAARFAPAAAGLEIQSEETREQRRSRVERHAWWAAGVALATMVLAAAIHYVGVQRELMAVQAERAQLRSQVDASLVGRSSVDATYRQVAALAGAARNAPRYSTVLAAVAASLPLDASLTAFRARGDSIFMDGVAERAAPVFDDIARMPGVTGVRATAPVRRDAIEGELPLEHFSLGALLTGARAPGPVKP